ncbi:proton-conducting transporter transmembrane domain-containing protein [Amnibacterium sp.]|uniref:proton-conducting transporter transmembrane domain-containing protein n=1 Tax=Amnibacterium sp. TaxID=1872496 RepID=UPI003F7C3DAA
MTITPLVLVLPPLIGAAAAAIPTRPDPIARTAVTLVATAAVLATAALALPQALAGPLGASDRFGLAAAGFVAALSAVVQGFALRHLRADPRQRWWIGWVNVLTAGALAVAVAPTVLTFAVGWSVTGAALVLLLATYRPVPQAVLGIRRTALAFVVGDAALWTPTLVLVRLHGGDLGWRDLPATAAQLPVGGITAAGLALVLTALSRSAQAPFHRWLPTTVAASTPVSAIMHAGVVNAATFLVVRFGVVLAEAGFAFPLLFVAGALSVLLGAAGMLVRPDLKSRLVASTTAQMGFMVLALAVGAPAAALIHLIGHGWYKAELFLRAGSQIDAIRVRDARPRAAPLSPVGRTVGTAAAAIVATGAVGTGILLAGSEDASALVLAALGSVTGTVVLRPILIRRTPAGRRLLAAIATASAGIAYAFAAHAMERFLAAGAPAQGPAVPWWFLLPVAALVVALSALPLLRPSHAAPLYGLLIRVAGSDLPPVRRARRARPALAALTHHLVPKDAE